MSSAAVPPIHRRSSSQKTCPVCAQVSPAGNLFCAGCGASLANVPEVFATTTSTRSHFAIPEYLLRSSAGRRIYDREDVGTGVVWIGFFLLIIPAVTANLSPLALAAWGVGITLVLVGLWRTKIDREAVGRAGLVTAAFATVTLGIIINHELRSREEVETIAPFIAEPTPEATEAPSAAVSDEEAGEEPAFTSTVPMPRGGPQQTGVLAGQPLTGNPYRLWRYDAGETLRSTPIVREGTAYIGTSDGFLVAVNLKDGTPRWRFDLGGYPVRSAPALGERTVYVASGYTFYAINANEGSERWRFSMEYAGESSPTVAGDTVYIASKEHLLFALDATTGERKWAYKTDGLLFGAPAVTDDLVIIGGDDGDIFAIEAESGLLSWKVEAGGGVYSTPAVDGDMVVVTLNDRTTLALDLATGKELWTYSVGGDASPAMIDGAVLVGSNDGGVYALDQEHGGPPTWLFATGSGTVTSPVVAGNSVYVAAGQTIFEIDRGTGEQRWRYPVGDFITTDLVVADGTLYVGARDGYLYAISGDGRDTSVGTPAADTESR